LEKHELKAHNDGLYINSLFRATYIQQQ